MFELQLPLAASSPGGVQRPSMPQVSNASGDRNTTGNLRAKLEPVAVAAVVVVVAVVAFGAVVVIVAASRASLSLPVPGSTIRQWVHVYHIFNRGPTLCHSWT